MQWTDAVSLKRRSVSVPKALSGGFALPAAGACCKVASTSRHIVHGGAMIPHAGLLSTMGSMRLGDLLLLQAFIYLQLDWGVGGALEQVHPLAQVGVDGRVRV
jgi:hypothetical protein